MSVTTLASLALIKTRYDTARSDLLDNFRPFVSYIIVALQAIEWVILRHFRVLADGAENGACRIV